MPFSFLSIYNKLIKMTMLVTLNASLYCRKKLTKGIFSRIFLKKRRPFKKRRLLSRTTFTFYRLPILFLGIFLFGNVSFLMAQDKSEYDGEMSLITSIAIMGLGRTRFSTAERPLRRFIGIEAREVDSYEVMAAIIATGILEPVSVEVQGEVLAVEVRERWSIFPVPIVMGGTGGFSGGLAFFDANAFGLNDQFFLAGFYLPNAWMASLGYIRSSRGGRTPGWSGMAIYARGERHDRDQTSEVLRRFEFDTIALHTGLHFPLLEDSDLLSASTLFSFNDNRLRNHANALYGPDSNLRLFGIGKEFSIRRNSWDGFFLSQEGASIRYSFYTSFGGVNFQSVRLQGAWERSLIPGFRLNLRTGAIFKPGAPVFSESSPGVSQVAILPREFSARNYAGLSAGLEKSIFRFAAGTLSFSAAYQVVHSHGSILGASFDHGCFGMISFYLHRLAIPALGLGVAYNVSRNYLQGFFSFGMSF